MEKTYETKSSFFEKINETDKPLTELVSKTRDSKQERYNVRNERAIDLTDIKRTEK